MQPLTVDDVRPPAVYEPVRGEARRQVIALKRDRRVAVGDTLTLVFENRETIRAVVEELLRAERIEEPARIAEELEVFNALIPAEDELSATLFVEITDAAELAPRLEELRLIEAHVHLEVDGIRVARVHEEGRTRDDRTAAVHYLRFRLDAGQRRRVLEGGELAVVADHHNYRARAALGARQRDALAGDLA